MAKSSAYDKFVPPELQEEAEQAANEEGKVHVSDKDREFAEKCNEAAKHNEPLLARSKMFAQMRDKKIRPQDYKLVCQLQDRIPELARIAAYVKVLVTPRGVEPKDKPMWALQAYRELKRLLLDLENAKEDMARIYGDELGLAMEEERRRGDEATSTEP